MAARITIKGRWCLTEAGNRLVPEGHPLGRWLWAVDGDERSREECERLGYGRKLGSAASNKMMRPERNKSHGARR